MKLRRALLLAPMLLLLWAGIASAQVPGPGDGYPPTILPTSQVTQPPPTAPPEIEGEVEAASQGGQGLARTGSNNIVPLIQAAIVLLGAGTLLVLVARRRSAVRRAAAGAAA